MITQLRIKNFQSHINTKINFCPGVNGIIGLSQAGKTSILRAFKLLRENRPSGFRFHNKYTKASKTSVSALFDDKIRASIHKSKKGTKFNLKNISGEKIPFSKVGKTVPDLISQNINLSKINVQSQLDNPFMVISSPGEIAREINKVTNSEMVDSWTSELSKSISQLKIKNEIQKDNLKINIKEKRKFKNLKSADKTISRLERLMKKRRTKEDLHFSLTEDNEKIQIQKRAILSLKKYSTLKKTIEQIENIQKQRKKIEQDFYLLIELKQQDKELSILIQEHKNATKQYIQQIKKRKQCPVCLHSIKSKDLKRIKNAIHIGL